MSKGVIIALIVIVAAVVLIAAFIAKSRGANGGRNLRKRFGPEYERTVARYDGDTGAAERELTARVERHGQLHTRPLEPAERQRYETRWAAAQERFVESPREAVTEADRLLAELAASRGFPAGNEYEEQVSALSVHHPHHVNGYRRIHRAALAAAGGAADSSSATEELREALVEGRALFDELIHEDRTHRPGAPAQGAREARGHGERHGRHGAAGDRVRSHLPGTLTRNHAKGS
ncbi:MULTISPECIES: hypothetical protein [Streptomyces]|uniref:hypothetical protein n=1 Tax=Streptomyces TaxID=1883 RepID=UPI0014080DF1|nr:MULTISPECIES: hypothetical protein [Streptomyces]MDH6227171.1 hypothetical protein [Streptomyces sp. MJP52]